MSMRGGVFEDFGQCFEGEHVYVQEVRALLVDTFL